MKTVHYMTGDLLVPETSLLTLDDDDNATGDLLDSEEIVMMLSLRTPAPCKWRDDGYVITCYHQRMGIIHILISRSANMKVKKINVPT